MINKPIEAITADDIDALVTDRISEGRLFELKRKLPGRTDSERREFAADITAFANAQGGDILYGIEDHGGVASRICGLAVDNLDTELTRLESILLNCVDPRIPGLRWRWIDRSIGNPVLLLRVPASTIAPHSVAISDTVRFHRRHNNRRSEMDVQELREAFTASDALPARIRGLHLEAVDMIARGNLPTGLGDEPKAVMSLIPATYFREIRDIDFDRENALMPARPNGQLEAIEMVEGVLMNSLPADQGAMRSLAITYRGGRIDTAWTVGRVVNDLRKEEVRLVWPKNFDDALLDGVLSGAARLHPHRITGPWFVHVTLLGRVDKGNSQIA